MNHTTHTLRIRRRLLGILPALSALSAWHPASMARVGSSPAPAVHTRRKKMVVAGPAASISNPLIHMAERGAETGVAENVEFVLWSNPDQLRMLAMGGEADFIAMPTNVAANLYNRGVPLTLINVAVWGMLWMVSRHAELQTLADFKGQELAIPFRADMPDILFSFLIEKQGLDPRRDFRLRYTATPMDAVHLLVMHQVDHALLAEPAVSMVLRKTRSFPLSMVAPELHRSVNVQEEWGRVLNREPRIPQAGIAVLGQARQDPGFVTAFEQAYAASNEWCLTHPEACADLVARHIPMLTPEAVADSIHTIPRHYATALEARDELDYFYRLLLDKDPAVVGGKMPDGDFYDGVQAPA